MRKDLLATGEVYHIFTRSIAGFKIFNNNNEFSRMIGGICYYQKEKPDIRFSKFINSFSPKKVIKENLVKIIAYCLMPTHLHLILKQIKEKGISIFMNNILNSYTRYFNIKHCRKGPLWEARFKNVLIKTDEQLLHLTRYIHLNPVTAYLVDKPDNWKISSYNEYLNGDGDDAICDYNDVLEIEPAPYKIFVEDMISYQRDLAKIKHLLLE